MVQREPYPGDWQSPHLGGLQCMCCALRLLFSCCYVDVAQLHVAVVQHVGVVTVALLNNFPAGSQLSTLSTYSCPECPFCSCACACENPKVLLHDRQLLSWLVE
jgi:hypothetical protein